MCNLTIEPVTQSYSLTKWTSTKHLEWYRSKILKKQALTTWDNVARFTVWKHVGNKIIWNTIWYQKCWWISAWWCDWWLSYVTFIVLTFKTTCCMLSGHVFVELEIMIVYLMVVHTKFETPIVAFLPGKGDHYVF